MVDNIKKFLSKNKLNDKYLDTYDKDTINRINLAIEGEIDINSECHVALNYGGLYYKINGINNKAESLFLKAFACKSPHAFGNLLSLYKLTNSYDKYEKLLLDNIEDETGENMCNLADFYSKQDRKLEAENYYLKAINKGHILALNNFGGFYYSIKDYTKAEHYFILAIEKGNIEAISNLSNMFANDLRLLIKLREIKNKTKDVENKIKKLEKSKIFRCYENKKNILSRRDQCPVCLDEDVNVIPTECAHFYCYDCFVIYNNNCQICDV